MVIPQRQCCPLSGQRFDMHQRRAEQLFACGTKTSLIEACALTAGLAKTYIEFTGNGQ
jgi:hypothetical protein